MSLFGTNVAAFTKTNAWLIKLGCPLTEKVLRNSGYSANDLYEKKKRFSSCPGTKVRCHWPLYAARTQPKCDHPEKKL